MKKTSKVVGARSWGKGNGSQCLKGTEFQFGKIEKSWRWMMRVAAQQCECTEHTKLHTQKLLKRSILRHVYFATIKKTSKPIKNWAKRLNRCFFKDIQGANVHMKRRLTSLVIRKMQVKTTRRYHFTLTRIAIIEKRERKNKAWWWCGEIGIFKHCW